MYFSSHSSSDWKNVNVRNVLMQYLACGTWLVCGWQLTHRVLLDVHSKQPPSPPSNSTASCCKTQAVRYAPLPSETRRVCDFQVNTFLSINSTSSPIEGTVLRGATEEKIMATMFSLRYFLH